MYVRSTALLHLSLRDLISVDRIGEGIATYCYLPQILLGADIKTKKPKHYQLKKRKLPSGKPPLANQLRLHFPSVPSSQAMLNLIKMGFVQH